MQIENKNIEELIPYINNPRNNDEAVDAVASSIKNFGFKVPIVIDGQNEIITGHTRYKAAKKLGLKEVPTIKASDLSPEQVKAFRLADNKVSEIATWDIEALNIELAEISAMELDLDMSDLGFEEIEAIKEVEEDEEFDPTPPEDPISQLGEIYQLGRHRLMVGDSTDKVQVESLMGGELADMLLTDPPYNVAYQGATKDALTIQNDNKSSGEFYLFLRNAFTAAKAVMKKGGAFYCWYASSEVVNFHNALIDSEFMVKQELIWNKNQMVLSRQDYHWKHEPCLYGWLAGDSHNWYSNRKQTTVLDFDKPQRNAEHPTMKPVKLFDYQIQNSSKPGDIILDLFGGSGTTLIAAEQNKRCAYLMEYDPRYADVIIKRWEELTGNEAVKIN
ncbi:DNA modification methylase [Lactococcus petauri]|uniref:DNA modification methylase n=1 Tax=Lactococcus petauri TaxID=1940789 RepID=UPI00385316BE